MIPRICLQKSLTASTAEPCPVSELLAVMRSDAVQDVCDRIKLLGATGEQYDKEQVNALKRELPAITPHAREFSDGKRSNATAKPSGLAMLDIDGVASPDDWAGKYASDGKMLRKLKVYLVAKTPSAHGIRMIFERKAGEDISMAQARIAAYFRIRNYDVCTKDAARLSYVMPWSYVYYFDEKGFEWKDEKAAGVWLDDTDPFANAGATPAAAKTTKTEETPVLSDQPTEYPEKYKEVPYSMIVDELVALHGGMAEAGERNSLYFSLCIDMRYICNFDAQFLLKVLPDMGLDYAERQRTAISALQRIRRKDLPVLLIRAIEQATHKLETERESNLPAAAASVQLPTSVLPPLLKTLCKRVPADYRPALVIALLPILGALATRVRFKYLDGQTHSFSFMSCVTAPAASGKSFIRKPVNLLLTPINEQDSVEREKERVYKEALRNSKNKQKQPEDPHSCPRNNGINVSIAALLKLLTNSGGKHLIAIGEEIDTLTKSERAGVWSQKRDIYRLAFDNALYGQQYISDNSFSANVNVYYNLLITGTPCGMYRFFNDVEDGLVTRVCFAELPDMFAGKIPVFGDYTDEEKAFVIEQSRYLDGCEGDLFCDKINTKISEWLECKRLLAIQSDSRSVDILRRRSAVIGFRAGYLCYLINKQKNATQSANFALWVANFVFDNQLRLFGKLFEQESEKSLSLDYSIKTRNLLDFLPQTFSVNDLISLRVKQRKSTDVSSIISRWKSSGLIKETSNKTYTKTKVI